MLLYGITLEPPQEVYLPGAELNALVYLITDKAIKARKIDVKVTGYAKSRWTKTYGKSTHTYWADLYVMNYYAVLWKSENGSNILPAGDYRFQFKFVIPSNAPPSVQQTYAFINYRVKTNIDIPWALDENRIQNFPVAAHCDLNLDDILARAAYTIITKSISACCSCKSSLLTVKVRIPQTGYVNGEHIPIAVEINNKSSAKVTYVESGIRQTQLYHSREGRTQILENKVAAERHDIDRISDEVVTMFVTVPNVSPSYVCPGICEISYTLFVIVHTNEVFSSGPCANFPLTIGTIPIQQPSMPVSIENVECSKAAASEKPKI